MEVTVKKTLNGVELHPAYTAPDGQEVPMKGIATYSFEVPELQYMDKKHLDLIPLLTDTQKEYISNLLNKAKQVIENL